MENTLTTLCVLWLFLAGFDAYATIRLLSKLGIDAELNPGIRKLCAWWGLKQGVLVGIFVPATAIAALAYVFHAQTILSVLIGMRLMLSFYQLRTIDAFR